ncbi:monovalent cation/H+ antiporter complex subunit F [Zavarzinia compransoris]|uniref:pH regulation protein F n=1 Tax=Zavarzinia compransoris TaxID=1264899 RepID=A0A317DZF5_9PROT|nr:monovalent cation/H+ antiporter complex subunit F [Zavarzinia compransoris]PWR19594.1 pH regulation protein F [Zavarzinia compransoris]TDP40422.1 multisubunit sodium/proton antiporter MrpF subunit [Zavarzinia compransoris]
MLFAAAAALFATLALALIRALAGPTVFDRILALNLIGTKTILLIAVLGFATDRYDFIDIALIYAVLNLIGTVAVMRYLIGERERA